MSKERPSRDGSRPTAAPASVAVDASDPQEVLVKAQAGRTIIQDFCPLAESLEWQLGQQYLRDRGNKAFIGDASPVPYVVNNDGTLSAHAADVFYTSLVEAEKAGTLAPDEDIFALELGIGVGLFARLFLDAFRQRCRQDGKDYYDRFCYIAADRSPRMLLDLCRHGVLARHAGHYCVRQIDAMEPEQALNRDLLFRNHKGPPLRACFLNYLLDCLPAAVLDIDGDQVKELHVRTVVARGIDLADHTDLTAEQLRERARFTDPANQRELLEVYGLFASEYDYRPADLKTMPHGDWVVALARGWTRRVLHSYGALQSLDMLLGLLHENGLILINDYGSEHMQMGEHFEHQRFSLATFVGINFALLEHYFTEAKGYRLVEPWGIAGGIHSRLLGRKPPHEAVLRFCKLFGSSEYERLQRPVYQARLYRQHARFELARTEYDRAVALQPYNWVLLNEVAGFLMTQLRGKKEDNYDGVKAGMDLAKLALAQNPTCSAELWSTLGDGLYDFGRYAEARSAYRKALRVNDQDVRARYNLAFVYLRERNFKGALRMIAEALELDKMGQYRDRLLQKLQEVLVGLTLRNQREYLLLINLVSQYTAARDEPKPAAPGEPTEERR
jgi:tetratricopeptide (TPR) repeat protein